jgi:hypothetical protein
MTQFIAMRAQEKSLLKIFTVFQRFQPEHIIVRIGINTRDFSYCILLKLFRANEQQSYFFIDDFFILFG